MSLDVATSLPVSVSLRNILSRRCSRTWATSSLWRCALKRLPATKDSCCGLQILGFVCVAFANNGNPRSAARRATTSLWLFAFRARAAAGGVICAATQDRAANFWRSSAARFNLSCWRSSRTRATRSLCCFAFKQREDGFQPRASDGNFARRDAALSITLCWLCKHFLATVSLWRWAFWLLASIRVVGGGVGTPIFWRRCSAFSTTACWCIAILQATTWLCCCAFARRASADGAGAPSLGAHFWRKSSAWMRTASRCSNIFCATSRLCCRAFSQREDGAAFGSECMTFWRSCSSSQTFASRRTASLLATS
mmetsp:Transcript_61693/g.177592  ORF Transcript_61693/g.177592 Transcript_61693/m.177592 type:complete len:310 (+) Transcript_61693:737-1666(+)